MRITIAAATIAALTLIEAAAGATLRVDQLSASQGRWFWSAGGLAALAIALDGLRRLRAYSSITNPRR